MKKLFSKYNLIALGILTIMVIALFASLRWLIPIGVIAALWFRVCLKMLLVRLAASSHSHKTLY